MTQDSLGSDLARRYRMRMIPRQGVTIGEHIVSIFMLFIHGIPVSV